MPSRICASRTETKCGSLCTNLSVLGQFGRLFTTIFPCVFLPGRITSNLHVRPRPAFFDVFVGDFHVFRISSFLSTQNDVLADLVQDQQQIGCAKKKCTHLHFDHFCTFVSCGCSMSVERVGGDEIPDFSPVGMARAEATSGCSGSWRFDGGNSEEERR